MTRPDARYGFRVVGPVTEGRRLVDAAAALSAHAACDPRADLGREVYLSAFRFGAEFRAHLTAHGTPKGYAGPGWSPWLWFDIDRPDPDDALADARKLVGFTLERYHKLDEDDLLVFYSGGKGYHVGVPLTHNPDPSPPFHQVARRLAEGLAGAAGVRIDPMVYVKIQPFRAPNSTHPRTGRRKRRLAVAELMNLSAVRIAELATDPVEFEVPRVGEVVAEIEADWNEAAEAAGRDRADRACRPHHGRLQRATLEFLQSGADVGERRPRLFRAAADLKGVRLAPRQRRVDPRRADGTRRRRRTDTDFL